MSIATNDLVAAAHDLPEELDAIDPSDCGCTECMSGEYRPLGKATDAEIQALFLGLLRDNTDERWLISRHDDGSGYRVSVGSHAFTVEEIAVPIPVEIYELTADQDMVDTIYSRTGNLT